MAQDGTILFYLLRYDAGINRSFRYWYCEFYFCCHVLSSVSLYLGVGVSRLDWLHNKVNCVSSFIYFLFFPFRRCITVILETVNTHNLPAYWSVDTTCLTIQLNFFNMLNHVKSHFKQNSVFAVGELGNGWT